MSLTYGTLQMVAETQQTKNLNRSEAIQFLISRGFTHEAYCIPERLRQIEEEKARQRHLEAQEKALERIGQVESLNLQSTNITISEKPDSSP